MTTISTPLLWVILLTLMALMFITSVLITWCVELFKQLYSLKEEMFLAKTKTISERVYINTVLLQTLKWYNEDDPVFFETMVSAEKKAKEAFSKHKNQTKNESR